MMGLRGGGGGKVVATMHCTFDCFPSCSAVSPTEQPCTLPNHSSRSLCEFDQLSLQLFQVSLVSTKIARMFRFAPKLRGAVRSYSAKAAGPVEGGGPTNAFIEERAAIKAHAHGSGELWRKITLVSRYFLPRLWDFGGGNSTGEGENTRFHWRGMEMDCNAGGKG